MSKWMKNKEKLFNKFKEEKAKEQDKSGAFDRSEIVWPTPEKGTIDNPKTYALRFLMDVNDNFYKSYHYHMFYSQAQERWFYTLCPKTFNFSNYCPFCAISSKLFLGSKSDKAIAYQMKRKDRNCVNVYVVQDPRDVDKIAEEKSEGKVLIYEFPNSVESKLKQQMNDAKYGLGLSIFDPGPDGFDFVLKVGATKPIQEEGPNKGKSFPKYDDSMFARKPSAIADSDDVIEQIMEKRHDLDAYLKNMVRDKDMIVEILKKEMLWDLIAEEASHKMGIAKDDTIDDVIPESKEEPKEEKADKPKEEPKEEKVSESSDDDDFLKELDNLDDDIPF